MFYICLYQSNLALSSRLKLVFQRIEQTFLLDSIKSKHHFQKDVLECAIANRPFKLSMLFLFQRPQSLQNNRDTILADTHFNQPSDFLYHCCRGEHLQQFIPDFPLHLKLLLKIFYHLKLPFCNDWFRPNIIYMRVTFIYFFLVYEIWVKFFLNSLSCKLEAHWNKVTFAINLLQFELVSNCPESSVCYYSHLVA